MSRVEVPEEIKGVGLVVKATKSMVWKQVSL